MQHKRIKELEAKVIQLEQGLLNAFTMLSQMDVIVYSMGEVLLEKKIYEKADVAKHISIEMHRRAEEPTKLQQPIIPVE